MEDDENLEEYQILEELTSMHESGDDRPIPRGTIKLTKEEYENFKDFLGHSPNLYIRPAM